MYKKHEVFKIQKSSETSIWRYMDFWKFLNLIDSSALYFSNSEGLGDKYEGRIPEFIVKEMLKDDKENGSTFNQDYINALQSNFRKRILISSWSYNQNESFAMWKMFAKSINGIAIETDIVRLKEAFNFTSREIYIGEVNYINEKRYMFSTDNIFYAFINKMEFYSFENEIRCLTVTNDAESAENKFVEVDLKTLIKKVHISPNSKPEFKKLIELIKSEYGLDFGISISKINDTWL